MTGRKGHKKLVLPLVLALAAVYGLDWSTARAAEQAPIDAQNSIASQTPAGSGSPAPRQPVVRSFAPSNGALVAPWLGSAPQVPVAGRAVVPSQPRTAVAAQPAASPLERTPATSTDAGATTKFNNTEMQFDGSWEYISNDELSQSKYQKDSTFSSVAGDTATFTFDGSSLSLMTTLDAHHGIVAVSVDGGPETMVDLYSSSRAFQQPIYSTGNLGSGSHTVTFRVTGQSNPSSTGNVITIDRLDVIA